MKSMGMRGKACKSNRKHGKARKSMGTNGKDRGINMHEIAWKSMARIKTSWKAWDVLESIGMHEKNMGKDSMTRKALELDYFLKGCVELMNNSYHSINSYSFLFNDENICGSCQHWVKRCDKPFCSGTLPMALFGMCEQSSTPTTERVLLALHPHIVGCRSCGECHKCRRNLGAKAFTRCLYGLRRMRCSTTAGLVREALVPLLSESGAVVQLIQVLQEMRLSTSVLTP